MIFFCVLISKLRLLRPRDNTFFMHKTLQVARFERSRLSHEIYGRGSRWIQYSGLKCRNEPATHEDVSRDPFFFRVACRSRYDLVRRDGARYIGPRSSVTSTLRFYSSDESSLSLSLSSDEMQAHQFERRPQPTDWQTQCISSAYVTCAKLAQPRKVT